MPLQQERPSITITLEERYNSQKAGGAYDVKSIKTAQGSRMPIVSSDGAGTSITDIKWTNPGFLVKEAMQQTEFKDALDGQTSKQLSLMLQGFDKKKYKP